MTRVRLSCGPAIALSLLASEAMAADRPIEPSSPWTLEGNEERCSLLRNFGTADERVQLQIDSFGRADSLLVTLVGEPVPRAMSVRGRLLYRFDADPAPRKAVSTTQGRNGAFDYVQFTPEFRPDDGAPDANDLPVDQRLSVAARVKAFDPEFEGRIRTLDVKFGRGPGVELAVGNMAQPLRALRDCLAKLHAHWGLDPVQQRELARYPAPSADAVGEIMANYPDIMASNGVNAYIPVRVMVDSNGQPGECAPQLPDVEGDFTGEICGAFKSARFEPALDQSGNPVSSFYQVHVLYTLD